MIVVGVQNQIDQMLLERGMQPRYMNGNRITDRETMRIVTEAVGEVRTQIEQTLSKVREALYIQEDIPDTYSPTMQLCHNLSEVHSVLL